jgi:hypothetical protein
MDGPVQISADFIMHTHAIGTRFDEDGGVGIGVLNHEMMIQFDVGEAPEGFSYWRAERKIRNKVAIHDVHMQHFDAGGFDRPNLFA